MIPKTCLRCDWQGETRSKGCPNCAAPLYVVGDHRPEGAGVPVRGHPEERSREAASTASMAPSGTPSRPPDPPPSSTNPVEPSSRSRRSALAFVLAALVLTVTLGSWLNAHRERPGPAADTQADLTGTLVYAVPDGDGWSRLWRWDLATGLVTQGPRVHTAIELVNASGANVGWVGVTSELADGSLRASVLRSVRPDDRPMSLLSGDIVGWEPRGTAVVAVRRGLLTSGCERRVTIRWAKLVTTTREQRFADPALCGDVLSVGVDDTATYFTLSRSGHVGVFLAGFHRIHLMLPDHALVGISSVGDMLVVPSTSLPGLPLVAVRPGQVSAELANTELFFRGLGSNTLTRYGVGNDRFAINRVLAWSPDASAVLVIGRLGDQRGVFELRAGPQDEPRLPVYLGTSEGAAFAAYFHDGTAIVLTQAGLVTVIGGVVSTLLPPTGAPAPVGPIVWLR